MRRRHLLAVFGASVAGLAGCSGGGSGGGEPTSASDQPTDTATPTQTASPTATATATATPEPASVTESVGTAFTVGEGDAAIGVTVRELTRAQALGPTQTEEADGTFVIVIMSVENPQSQSIDVPSDRMKLRAEGTIKNVDIDASEAVTSDSRLDVDSVAATSVTSGGTKTGAIVFDAPPEGDYRLEITPPSEAGRTHVVPVGPIGDLPAVEEGY